MGGDALANLVPNRAIRFLPDIYDALFEQFCDFNFDLARICSAILGFSDPKKIVELGCGTGLFAASALRALSPELFVGIDPSEPMIARAQRRLAPFHVLLIHDTAQNLEAHIPPGTADVIFVKSAYHHFQNGLAFSALLRGLTQRGRLIIIERTARSAASYPIFDEARDYWQAYFARQSLRPLDPSFAGQCAFGDYVRISASEYYRAIETGQLSFTWSFDQALVSRWAEQARSSTPRFVDVYEEYDIRTFSKTARESGPQ